MLARYARRWRAAESQPELVLERVDETSDVTAPATATTSSDVTATGIPYRAEIDGLRAIAVVPVVLFHAGISELAGGFIGVDVFFVISGYLITSLIADDLRRGRFTFTGFYERRIRRILPALYAVLAFSAVAAVGTTDPRVIGDVGASLLSVLAFVSNIHFWQASGYFGDPAELNPLLHTWSLAVEEQFYVLFPVLLAISWSLGRRKLALLLAVLAAASLASAEWGWRNDATANFFLTPSRVWELLIGALVALTPVERVRSAAGEHLSQAASLVCLLVLVAVFFVFDSDTPHPSLFTLLPVAATAGLILFCNGSGVAGAILCNRFMVGIGLVSYSLYLWHQPIFVFTRLYSPAPPDLLVFGLLGLMSLGIAYLSWRFIEQPFRNRRRIDRRQVFVLAGATSSVAAAVGAMLMVGPAVPLRLLDPTSHARYQIIDAADPQNRAMVNSGCHLWSETFTDAFRTAFDRCAERHGKAIFITGGSHGMDLYNAIARSSTYPFIVSVSRGFCRPHRMLRGRQPPYPCHYEELMAFAIEHAEAIDVILYTQTPDRLFTAHMRSAERQDLSVPAINEALDYLASLQAQSGVDVVIIGMLPPLLVGPNAFDFRRPIPEQIDASFAPRLLALTRYTDRVFAEHAANVGLDYVSKIDAFGLQLPDDVLVDGQLTYSDRRHLTAVGERYFGRRLVHRLVDLGHLPSGARPPDGAPAS